jgi:hypothetical protein
MRPAVREEDFQERAGEFFSPGDGGAHAIEARKASREVH